MQALDQVLDMAPWFVDHVDAARFELLCQLEISRKVNSEVRELRRKNELLSAENAKLRTVNEAFTLKLGRAGGAHQNEVARLVSLIAELRDKEELLQKTVHVLAHMLTPEQRAELKFRTAEQLTLERKSAPGRRSNE